MILGGIFRSAQRSNVGSEVIEKVPPAQAVENPRGRIGEIWHPRVPKALMVSPTY